MTISRVRRLLALAGVFTVVSLLPIAGASAGVTDPEAVAARTDTETAGSSGSSAAGVAPTAPIVVTLRSTSPTTPPAVAEDTIVTVVISVANNTGTALSHLEVAAERDSPIISPTVLQATLAKPAPPADENLTQPMPTVAYPDVIAPHTTATLRYEFPASTIRETGGVCLCQDGIYPVDLTVFAATAPRNAVTRIGWLQTYLISVIKKPVPTKVSWLWPLIDRPHRLSVGGPFLDDDLAGEITTGGRLDRALQVVEAVSPASGIDVVIDPELVDEIVVMSEGYRVQQGATTVPGPGGGAARDWLQRLRVALSTHRFTLTPWNDPAIDAIAQTGALWPAMPFDVAGQVESAIGQPITAAQSALAWPPGEMVTPAALADLAAGGASTVLLNDTALPGGKGRTPPLPAAATVPVTGPASSSVTALVTSSALQSRVHAMLDPNGSQLATLPALQAELALRTLQEDAEPSFIVLAPDRYVDTTPATAAAVITGTTQASWLTAVSADAVATTIKPVDHGKLVAPDSDHYGGSSQLLASAQTVGQFVSEFSSALQVDPASTVLPAAAAALVATFPSSIQLANSAGWVTAPTAARSFDATLSTQVTQLSERVQILRPANGTYSLASASAPLLITVVNNLPVPIRVRVSITSADGIPGFRTDDAGLQTIPPNTHHTIKIQAHVARSGHFRANAQLLMPGGATLGATIQLSIYSSALGTIGVVITIVALAVLVLALLNRFRKRWRHHREIVRMMANDPPVPPVPAGISG